MRSGNTEVEFPKAREYLVKLLQPITEDELAVLDLNANKKSVDDLTNGMENGDTSSIKSNQAECSEKDIVENGSQMSRENGSQMSRENGSQVSSRIDLDDDQSKSECSGRDATEGESETKEVLVNGEETEGVYDLAPRSTDTYSKKMMAYNNMNDEEKEEMRRLVQKVLNLNIYVFICCSLSVTRLYYDLCDNPKSKAKGICYFV